MTKKKFLDYEQIRASGRTNMIDVNTVRVLSEEQLTEEDCYDIMENYSEYAKKYINQ